MIELLVKVALAYALGNLMGGDVAGRLGGGVDLRREGSGNVGATNAVRTLGVPLGLLAFAIDVGKGVAAVLLIPALPWPWPTLAPQIGLVYACGFAAVLGHCYPVLHGFRGGKGVATAAGVFAAVLPLALPWMLLGTVLVATLTGYMSLASITGAAIAGLYVACFDERGFVSALGAFTSAMMALVVFRHRHNIVSLARGEEKRFEKLRVLGRWLDP